MVVLFRGTPYTRAEYERLTGIVRQVVHAWDPYGLLGNGGPPDEFDGEVASLVAQVPRIASATDAAHAVSRVFSSAFEPTGFCPSDCAVIGTQLFNALAGTAPRADKS